MTLPHSSTIAFLFTDIEGSTRLAQEYPDAVGRLFERHDRIIKSSIEARGGRIFQTVGDAFCAAFPSAGEALEAAIEAQRSLAAEDWSPEPVRVRMGLSTGSAQANISDGGPPDYSGYLSLARVHRIMSLAHGGQILLSGASAELLRSGLRPDVTLHDLGEHHLKGIAAPERLWQVMAPGLQQDFPPPASLAAIPNNLPIQLTSFVGRQQEIADVEKLLQEHRLVTLTGPGGTGKTRLSVQIATDILPDYPDGIWLVELAPVRDAALIPQTVLHVFGLLTEAGRQPLDILIEYLAGKSVLIILDNCEHLLAECGSFVQAVLQAAPAVKILSTSRELLNLAGEQAYRVPSLQVPHEHELSDPRQLGQFDAVRLFVERVSLVSPGFAITRDNAASVAQICRRLDGIPLAIELAAARVRSMPLEAVVSRLDDRLRLLTGGSRNALPRQQTLRAAIDWSYALLSEHEKLLLQRLSVFRGGCTLDEAEAVCGGEGIEEGDVLDLLSKLVDKSLLNLDEAGRYEMLETVRQYAGEKLIDAGQAEWARDRHLRFLVDLAERAEPEVRGHDQLSWLNRLEAELDNWRAALAWAQDGDPESFLRLASALWRFWSIRLDAYEAIDRLAKALSQSADRPTAVRAMAFARLVWMMYGGYGIYSHKPAGNLAQQAYDLSAAVHDKRSMALALWPLALSHIWQEPNQSVSLAWQELDLARELDDHWLARGAFQNLGIVAMIHNDLGGAGSFFEQALAEARLSGDQRGVANTLSYVAWIRRAQGGPEQARKMLEEALSTAEAIGDRANVVLDQMELAHVAFCQEDYSEAEALLTEALAWAKSVNHRTLMALGSGRLGILECARGNGPAVCEREEACLRVARQNNDEIVSVEALCLLAQGQCLVGELDLAQASLSEALTLARSRGFRPAYCYAFQGLGGLALLCGDPRRAVRLLAARDRLRETAFAEDYYPFMVRERERLLAEARAQLSDEAFNAEWAAGRAMGEEEMLAYALEPMNGALRERSH